MTLESTQTENLMAAAPLKITAVRSRVVNVPLKRKVVSRIGVFDSMWFLLVDMDTDAGITGSTYLWAFSKAGARALQKVLDELAEVAIGQNPFFATRIWRGMWSRISQWGHKGLSVIGMAGIDICIWDIMGKATNRPLAHLLGASLEAVPTYASEGLWLTGDMNALAREAEELLVEGFKAVKMRLGRTNMADDVEAVRIVRETIGQNINLMADANQGWDVNYTIRIGRQLEKFNLFWLEEPIAHDNLEGHARIAEALDTPLASGENMYSPYGFREAIEQKAFDILMPDLERVGGVTGFMRTIALAEAWNLPICSHLFPEASLHLIAAAPTACFLEHMPWGKTLFQEEMPLVDGKVAIPNRPGIGFSWDETAVRRYLVD